MDHPAFQATQSSTPSVPETTAPPEQPAKHSSKNWKKWIIIGGIILVVLLTGSAYVLSQQKSQEPKTKTVTQPTISQTSPTTDPTAEWKTYTSSANSFTFKYPPILEEDPKTKVGVLVPSNRPDTIDSTRIFVATETYHQSKEYYIKNVDTGVRYNGVNLMISTNNSSLPLAAWTERYRANISAAYERSTKKAYNLVAQAIKIGSRPGVHLSGDGRYPIDFYIAELPNKKMLVIHKMEKDKGSFTKEFNQILSTFKFTEQTIDMSNWKTYTSLEYHFTIKYPPTWKTEDAPESKDIPEGWVDFVSDVMVCEPEGDHSGCNVRIKYSPNNFPATKLTVINDKIVDSAGNPLTTTKEALADVTAYRTTDIGAMGDQLTYVVAGADNNFHVFGLNPYPHTSTVRSYLENNLKQMLSTFKFTQP